MNFLWKTNSPLPPRLDPLKPHPLPTSAVVLLILNRLCSIYPNFPHHRNTAKILFFIAIPKITYLFLCLFSVSIKDHSENYKLIANEF